MYVEQSITADDILTIFYCILNQLVYWGIFRKMSDYPNIYSTF